jgi:hypothetical protein
MMIDIHQAAPDYSERNSPRFRKTGIRAVDLRRILGNPIGGVVVGGAPVIAATCSAGSDEGKKPEFRAF